MYNNASEVAYSGPSYTLLREVYISDIPVVTVEFFGGTAGGIHGIIRLIVGGPTGPDYHEALINQTALETQRQAMVANNIKVFFEEKTQVLLNTVNDVLIWITPNPDDSMFTTDYYQIFGVK